MAECTYNFEALEKTDFARLKYFAITVDARLINEGMPVFGISRSTIRRLILARYDVLTRRGYCIIAE